MADWTQGNQIQLLENGEEYFPAVLDDIGAAKEEILVETFIWNDEQIGQEIRDALTEAARRGVRVHAVADDFGSPDLTPEFVADLVDAGAEIIKWDPKPTLLRVRTNPLCRLHRKTFVIDNTIAYIGGMNIAEMHFWRHGEKSMQDYAVRVVGPVVEQIRNYSLESDTPPTLRNRWRYWMRWPQKMQPHSSENAQVAFVYRDNAGHPTDIETMYRRGIRESKESILLANAYFFPGYRFTRELKKAARRGVDVRMILQGNPDRPLSVAAASIIHEDLLAAGVRIFLYKERPLHAKVAVIDRNWSTVGSSNLDPVSLGLNYESNLFILDEDFNAALRASLERVLAEGCEEVGADTSRPRSAIRRVLITIGYHLTRKMWSWGKRIGPRKVRKVPVTGGVA